MKCCELVLEWRSALLSSAHVDIRDLFNNKTRREPVYNVAAKFVFLFFKKKSCVLETGLPSCGGRAMSM